MMATAAKTMSVFKLVYLGSNGWVISLSYPNDFLTAQGGQRYIRNQLESEQRKIYKLVKFTSTRRLKV